MTLATALLTAGSLFAQLPPDSVIRRYAAGMLMVGFKGDSVTENCDAARYVRDLKVGAIVLFDIDVTGDATLGSRNITSKELTFTDNGRKKTDYEDVFIRPYEPEPEKETEAEEAALVH